MKKILIFTAIILLLGFIFLNRNSFVEQEKEVVVQNDAEQTSIVNVYFVAVDKQNNQNVVPVKRKILKNDIYKNTIKVLLYGPNQTEAEKKHLSTEIPRKTKLLGVNEYSDMVMINFSKDFETGGGSNSMTVRLEQVANTVSDMTDKPVYLYIEGKEVSVLGGDGIMVKQPINIVK